jgi:DNA-directed RNA polymerase delta subunit
VEEAQHLMRDPGEIAYRIVKERGTPIPTRELLEKVLDALGFGGEERQERMAEVYTAIALDNRLVAVEREWVLRDWAPKPKTPRGAARVAAIAPRKLRREPPEDEEEEGEEELLEDELEEAEVVDEEPEGDWD